MVETSHKLFASSTIEAEILNALRNSFLKQNKEKLALEMKYSINRIREQTSRSKEAIVIDWRDGTSNSKELNLLMEISNT